MLAVLSLAPLSLHAKCQYLPNGRLELRAPAGNLLVSTTGTDSVEVQVSNRQVTVQETCERDKVTITGKAPTSIGIPDWKITVPRGITLDLSTQGGSIQVADTDGEALLRTSGGKVTAGNIGGNALIYGTEVRTGNIGGNAELRGLGGRLQLGDIGGSAEFHTPGGDITAGIVKGTVKATMESGSISIREAVGNVVVTTKEGDITSEYVRGSFDGKTESGNIHLEKVGSWGQGVYGSWGYLLPARAKQSGRRSSRHGGSGIGKYNYVRAEGNEGQFRRRRDKPAMSTKSILSNIPLKAPINAFNKLIPGGPEKQTFEVNKGGNAIRLRTSSGTIRIMQN
jgi:hypothetical protein